MYTNNTEIVIKLLYKFRWLGVLAKTCVYLNINVLFCFNYVYGVGT